MAQKKKKEVIEEVIEEVEVIAETAKPELYNVSVYNLVGKVESYRGVECLVDVGAVIIGSSMEKTIIPYGTASKIVIQKA